MKILSDYGLFRNIRQKGMNVLSGVQPLLLVGALISCSEPPSDTGNSLTVSIRIAVENLQQSEQSGSCIFLHKLR